MNILLEGGNWQDGLWAGSFHITPLDWSCGRPRIIDVSAIYRHDERYDGLPPRWVAIIKATNVRKCREVMALLEAKERK
jgi:hypothetical protein